MGWPTPSEKVSVPVTALGVTLVVKVTEVPCCTLADEVGRARDEGIAKTVTIAAGEVDPVWFVSAE